MTETWDALLTQTARGDADAADQLIARAHDTDSAHAALIREAATPPELPEPGLFDSPLPKQSAIPQDARDRWEQLCAHLQDLTHEDSDLIDALDHLLARWPVQARFVPDSWQAAFMDPSADHPALRLFRRLDHDFGQGALHQTPHLRHITHLCMEGVDARAETWAELATSPHLSQLLALNCCGAIEGSSLALVTSPNLSGLRALDMASCELKDHHLKILASAPNLAGLEILNLGKNPDWNGQYFGAEGLAALATSPHLTGLRVLDLTLDNEQPAAAWQTLFHSLNMRHIERLLLSHYIMDIDGLLALVSSPNLGALSCLFLGAIDVGDQQEVVDALQSATGLGALRELFGEGFGALADALIGHPSLPALERVSEPPY